MTEQHSFKPGSELTFKSVSSVRDSLYKALMTTAMDVFKIDLSAVKRCDSAGLALLIEARKLCNQHAKQLEVVGISKETEALAEFCGVEGIWGHVK